MTEAKSIIQIHKKIYAEKNNFIRKWYLISFLITLFIFIMVFIESGIIVALFFFIWFNTLYLLIFYLFRNHELHDNKGKIKNNDIETEIINKQYTIIKEKYKFIIENNLSNLAYEYLIGLIITLVATIPILILDILIQIIKYSKVIEFLSIILITIIFIIILNTPWIIVYLYYKNRKIVCIIDINLDVILLNKLLPRYKVLKKIGFHDLATFRYFLSDSVECKYSLIITDINGVVISLFYGTKEECVYIYNKISDFVKNKFHNM